MTISSQSVQTFLCYHLETITQRKIEYKMAAMAAILEVSINIKAICLNLNNVIHTQSNLYQNE